MMNPDVQQVLTYAASALSVMGSGFIAALLHTYKQEKKYGEDRVAKLEATTDEHELAIGERTKHADHMRMQMDMKELDKKVTEDEKRSIRMEGEINLVRQGHAALITDVEEIKNNMVTRAEWEPHRAAMEKTMNQILAELRGAPRYPSGAMRYPSPLPPDPKKQR